MKVIDVILAVVKNTALHERQAAEWAKHGIGAQRVDTMHEAMIKLKNGEQFFFVVINEDCIPDYLTQLPIMSDITDSPIIVVSSTYTIEKKLITMREGARMYVPFNERIEHDALVTIEVLTAQKRTANNSTVSSTLYGGDIIMSLPRRTVLVKGEKVDLSPTEFAILQLLMEQRGITVSREHIYECVWNTNHTESENFSLWGAIKRLRQKLKAVSDGAQYIETVRGSGYRFSA